MKGKERTKVDELRDALKRKKEAEEMHNGAENEEAKASHVQDDVEVRADTKGASAPGSDVSVDEMADQIRAAEIEAKGHYDKLLRVMAEFDNFKKRMQREREDLVKYGNEKLLLDLLVPLDDLSRVLSHVPPESPKEARVIAEGVELVLKSFASILDKFGIKEIRAEGEKFDPSCHEAIAVVDSEAHEPGSVMAVHRKGYKLEDRVIRPALVTVSKASVANGKDGNGSAGPGGRSND